MLPIQSENTKQISSAIIKVRGQMGPVTKSTEGHHGYYADNFAVIESCMSLLLAEGLMTTQSPMPIEGIDYLVTQILHAESGEFLRSYTRIVNGRADDPQAQGSAITYVRRYALEAILCIQREDADDDGEGAMPADKAKTSQEKPQSQLKPADDRKIKANQAGMLFHRFNDCKFTPEEVKAYLIFNFKVEKKDDLTNAQMDVILAEFKAGTLKPLTVSEAKNDGDDRDISL